MQRLFSIRVIRLLTVTAATLSLPVVPSFAIDTAGHSLSKTTVSASANSGNPPIVPVQWNPYGLSYGDWSAQFWRWEFSLPVNGHPLAGNNGDCSAGQSGPVWFLGGTFTTTPGPP